MTAGESGGICSIFLEGQIGRHLVEGMLYAKRDAQLCVRLERRLWEFSYYDFHPIPNVESKNTFSYP